jgi:arylsulfatase A-like enzyme
MRLSAFVAVLLLFSIHLSAQQIDSSGNQNIIVVTIDGLRWQELFNGANEKIINEGSYVSDTGIVNEMYWDNDVQERRKKLLPFLWSVVAKRGQIYGNRDYGNKMNVANRYKFSYPGYSEMFTGYPDRKFVPNTPVLNRNTNIFEFLNHRKEYKGKIAAFSSWNIFPFILNEKRSGFTVNSGYEKLDGIEDTLFTNVVEHVQDNISDKGHTRYDELTFLNAREYIKQNHPKVALVSFGEADEFAHHGHYDKYLQSIANTDRMIAELWYYIQTDPFYKNNTTLLITTDHGRGCKTTTWTDHLFLIKGSREVWMAVMGPGIAPLGEMKDNAVLYQKQIAATIAGLLGQQFTCEHSVGKAIDLPQQQDPALSLNGVALQRP